MDGVEDGAQVGDGTVVWPGATVRAGAIVGSDCIIGRGAYVDAGVRIGNRCKLQNNALVYEPAVLGDGVFIGPAAVLTNDRFPRAVRPDGTRKTPEDWSHEGVTVGDGASVGAGAMVLAGVRIGAWAVVAAGAVVTRDVVDFACVAGTPARFHSWVGHAGVPLVPEVGGWRCPRTDTRYREHGPGVLRIEE